MPGSPGTGESRGVCAAGQQLRCPGCCKPERHQCAGRRDAANRPLCSCIQCHGAAIRADAALYADPMVVELYRYVLQVRDRDRKAATWPQQPRKRTCMAPDCGNTAVSRRFGPRRKYCSDACRYRAYRTRKRAQRNAVQGEVMEGATSAPRTATSRTGSPGTGNDSPAVPYKPPAPAELERLKKRDLAVAMWLDRDVAAMLTDREK